MPDQPTFVVNDRRKFTAQGELRHEENSSSRQTAPDAEAPAVSIPAAEEHSAESGAAERQPAPVLSFPQATATQAPAQDVLNTATPVLEQLADLPESGVLDQAFPDTTVAPHAGYDELADPYAEADIQTDADSLPPGPTAEESTDAQRAYEATVERLDLAMRSADPGGDRLPPMSFERLTQSLYTQALMLLGGGTQPGEQPRVDILGARQTIDMLTVVAQKTAGNLSPDEDKLVQSALFDLRMGFLEITQALARQAAQRQPAAGTIGGAAGSFGGPAIPGGGGPRIIR